MFGISLFYYYITTASLLCQYLLKNLFKNYFSRKYRYIKAFRDSLFFVEKNFLGFFLFFFWAFASARKKGRRKAGESGRRKGHAGKILRPTAGRGKYTEQLPKKRKDRKEETKKIGSRIPQKGEGRKARGNITCREVCGSCRCQRESSAGIVNHLLYVGLHYKERVQGVSRGKALHIYCQPHLYNWSTIY